MVQDQRMLPHASALPSPPHRHGADLATTRRIASRLRLMIRGNPEPTPDEWARLGSALWRGDPLADDLAHWLAQVGMGAGRPMLERAIEHGIDAVPGAPEVLCHFMQAVEHPIGSMKPNWPEAPASSRAPASTACWSCATRA